MAGGEEKTIGHDGDAEHREVLISWLGFMKDEFTDEQFDRLVNEYKSILSRYPDSGDPVRDSRVQDAALSAAAQWLLGETPLGEARSKLEDARRRREEAFRKAECAWAAAVQLALMAHADGMSESDAAEAIGVGPETLREALGASMGPDRHVSPFELRWYIPDEITHENYDRLVREIQSIWNRYPDPGDYYLRDAAKGAAALWLLGKITLERARQLLEDAQIWAAVFYENEECAMAAAVQLALMAHADGMSESDAAEAVGIDLATLREALDEY